MRSYPSAEDDPLSSSSQAITEVYVWGNNRFGQLGLGEKYKGQVLELPKFCSFNLTISQISCGSDFTVFITLKGHIYSMGSNKKGALGLGEEGSNVSATSSPLLVESLCSQMACGVSCGANHTMVLVEDGRAYSWGSGETGQTSLGNYETTNVPTEIKTADQGNGTLPFFKQVSCGASNSGLITSEGHVYLCGDNQHGQLANGKTGKENKLVRCQFFAEKIKNVTIGDSHVLFLTGMNKFEMNNDGGVICGEKRMERSMDVGLTLWESLE
jgi:alpha-tubulin suppressor-like RCC1 family protein